MAYDSDMFYGHGTRIVPQRDLYHVAVERRRRRLERERTESVRALRGLVLACLLGGLIWLALLAL